MAAQPAVGISAEWRAGIDSVDSSSPYSVWPDLDGEDASMLFSEEKRGMLSCY